MGPHYGLVCNAGFFGSIGRVGNYGNVLSS